MNAEERSKLRKLAEAATPGPWTADPHSATTLRDATGRAVASTAVNTSNVVDADALNAANMAYIAACSPATVLALLDALDECDRERAAEAREKVL